MTVFLLTFLAQTVATAPAVFDLVKNGGPLGLAAVMAAVVVYQDRRIADLHATIHARDEAHAKATGALRDTHSAELARVTEQRIDELETVAKGLMALDKAVTLAESLTRSTKR